MCAFVHIADRYVRRLEGPLWYRTYPQGPGSANGRNLRKPADCSSLRKSVACGHSVLPQHRGQIRHWDHRTGRQRQHIAIPILPLFA